MASFHPRSRSKVSRDDLGVLWEERESEARGLNGPFQRDPEIERSVSAPPDPAKGKWTNEPDESLSDILLDRYNQDTSEMYPPLHLQLDQFPLDPAEATSFAFLHHHPQHPSQRFSNRTLTGTPGVPSRSDGADGDAATTRYLPAVADNWGFLATRHTCMDSPRGAGTQEESLLVQLQHHRSPLDEGNSTTRALRKRGVRGGLKPDNSHGRSAIVRPKPIKTTASAGASTTVLVAPQARTVARSIEEESQFLGQQAAISSVIEENELITKSEVAASRERKESEQRRQVVETGNSRAPSSGGRDPRPQREPWCDQAGKRAEEEEKRKRKEQEDRRNLKLQQAQSDFPPIEEYQNKTMASLSNGSDEVHRDPESAAVEAVDNRTTSGRSVATRASRKPGATEGEGRPSVQRTPLFDHYDVTEYQEVRTYQKMVESQARDISKLKLQNNELEARLEMESKSRQRLEATLESREREWSYRLDQWSYRLDELVSDRDQWKERVKEEESKNERLMELSRQKENEIMRMLQRKVQRKYDPEGSRNVRGLRGTAPSERNERPHKTQSRSPELHRPEFNSPLELFNHEVAEGARLGNTKNLLKDFFGM